MKIKQSWNIGISVFYQKIHKSAICYQILLNKGLFSLKKCQLCVKKLRSPVASRFIFYMNFYINFSATFLLKKPSFLTFLSRQHQNYSTDLKIFWEWVVDGSICFNLSSSRIKYVKEDERYAQNCKCTSKNLKKKFKNFFFEKQFKKKILKIIFVFRSPKSIEKNTLISFLILCWLV